jgi:formylglycine-generating enzyme required for sulfatase activity
MGFALAQAQSWLARRAEDLVGLDKEFIDLSIKRERKVTGRAQRIQALVYMLFVGIIAGLVGWINQSYLQERANWFWTMRPYMMSEVRPYVLRPDAERALKPLTSFRECAKDCPEMIVIPAGEFTMGSPMSEQGRFDNEGPQHKVTIAKPFAVAKFDVTFAEWDACVQVGGCPRIDDRGKGRGRRPVVYVTWDQARRYVAWLSQMTDQPYRLLTEAEWEYAARAWTTTAYYWGDEIGTGNANCNGCGSQWDSKEPAPVGSFAANAFGLHDMVGNVWQWVDDCEHNDYTGAPTDGSAWTSGECNSRVTRGGSWFVPPENLRSAGRAWDSPALGYDGLGFRIARSLLPHSP